MFWRLVPMLPLPRLGKCRLMTDHKVSKADTLLARFLSLQFSLSYLNLMRSRLCQESNAHLHPAALKASVLKICESTLLCKSDRENPHLILECRFLSPSKNTHSPTPNPKGASSPTSKMTEHSHPFSRFQPGMVEPRRDDQVRMLE